MRRLGALTLGAVMAACGGARHAGRSDAGGTPFTVGRRSEYGIQAQLDGTISMHDRWVYVVVPKGSVRTWQLDRQDYWDLRLRAGVASCTDRGFEIVSEGRAARLLPLLGLSRDSATLDATPRPLRDTLRLDVGLPSGTEPSRSWVALIFEWPFQSVMATYTVHTDVPLSGAPWTGAQAEEPGRRCRQE